mmetsp:Transcript_19954/g.44295  ORF Transcript_19954/g.44295 Transcript_19954/m.44295 type:complete len:228 (+) Transcript_19954:179-862(+)
MRLREARLACWRKVPTPNATKASHLPLSKNSTTLTCAAAPSVDLLTDPLGLAAAEKSPRWHPRRTKKAQDTTSDMENYLLQKPSPSSCGCCEPKLLLTLAKMFGATTKTQEPRQRPLEAPNPCRRIATTQRGDRKGKEHQLVSGYMLLTHSPRFHCVLELSPPGWDNKPTPCCLPDSHCPAYERPSGQLMFPSPCESPDRNWPTYCRPSGQLISPCPCITLLTQSPV